jgi:predicted HTH transcriptional regulator
MWVPHTWSDLEPALGEQIEGVGLDFKSALPPKGRLRDLAKDAAAMSIGGGVILVGVAERDGVATEITAIELKGAMERVQQAVQANTAPALAIEVTPLREQEGDETGVLVISIPAFWSAPHEYEGRFPARAGATTRYLGEQEVENL